MYLMGYTHYDKVCANSFAIGAHGTEVELPSMAGADRAIKVAKVALGAKDTGGGVLAWASPDDILIQRIIFDVTTESTGACTLDVGTTATGATTSSDNLMDGINVATAGVFDNITNKGESGKSLQKLAKGKWVTASKATGSAAGLAGFAYIEYVVI
jgi:hypothetical protein